jgi:phosphotransacetylase
VSDILQACIARARAAGKRLVLPEGEDERIQRAAQRISEEGIARPVLLSEAPLALPGVEVLVPSRSERLAAYARDYIRARRWPTAS